MFMFIDASFKVSNLLNRIFVEYLPLICLISNIFIFLPEEYSLWPQKS